MAYIGNKRILAVRINGKRYLISNMFGKKQREGKTLITEQNYYIITDTGDKIITK